MFIGGRTTNSQIRAYFWVFCEKAGLNPSFFAGKHSTYNNKTRFLKTFLRTFNDFFDFRTRWINTYCDRGIPIEDEDQENLLAIVVAAQHIIEDLEHILTQHSRLPDGGFIARLPKINNLKVILNRLLDLVEDKDRCLRDVDFSDLENKLIDLFNDIGLAKMLAQRLHSQGYFLDNVGNVYKIELYRNLLAVPEIDAGNPDVVLMLRQISSGIIGFMSSQTYTLPDLEKIFDDYPCGLFGVKLRRNRNFQHLIFVIKDSNEHDYTLGFAYLKIKIYIYHYVNLAEHNAVFVLNKVAQAKSKFKYGHICNCKNWAINDTKINHIKNDGLPSENSVLKKYDLIANL